MGKILKTAALGIGAVGVFSGSVAIFMMSRGELNREGLSRLPVVGGFVPAPETEASDTESDTESDSNAGESEATQAPATDDAAKTSPGGDDKKETPAQPRSDLFDRADAFESGEMEALLADLTNARESYRARLSGLDSRDRALSIEAEELVDRRAQLQQLVDSVELDRVELERERKRMEQGWVRFEETEAANIKKLGKKLEGMAPDKLSKALGEMDRTDVVKILSAMNDRRAAKVFDAMTAEEAAQVMELMKGLVDETKKADATGN